MGRLLGDQSEAATEEGVELRCAGLRDGVEGGGREAVNGGGIPGGKVTTMMLAFSGTMVIRKRDR